MAETPTIRLRHTKSFKKYTEEYQPAVVDFVRAWARAEPLVAFHEDASLVKVTGTKEQVEQLLATLKERFGYVPPEEAEGKAKGDAGEE